MQMHMHTYNLSKLEKALDANNPVKLITLGAELSVNEYPLLRHAILRAVRWQQRRCQLVSFINGLMVAVFTLLGGAAAMYCIAAVLGLA